jgi:hypothetical protein
MHLVQTFSYFLHSPSPALALKTFRCRTQAGPLHRKQRPPSEVANSREQTEQRHLMDSQDTTFDTEVIRSSEAESRLIQWLRKSFRLQYFPQGIPYSAVNRFDAIRP